MTGTSVLSPINEAVAAVPRARFSVKPAGQTSGYVDRASWPWSLDLALEIPAREALETVRRAGTGGNQDTIGTLLHPSRPHPTVGDAVADGKSRVSAADVADFRAVGHRRRPRPSARQLITVSQHPAAAKHLPITASPTHPPEEIR